jgi:hypothetical protein
MARINTSKIEFNNDLESAKLFIETCIDAHGLGFHPDTVFEDYRDENGIVYTWNDAEILNHYMENSFVIFKENNIDIYNYCLDLLSSHSLSN